MFASHKEDRKRVQSALQQAELPHSMKECIDPEVFDFDKFLSLYLNLCGRAELQEIFQKLLALCIAQPRCRYPVNQGS